MALTILGAIIGAIVGSLLTWYLQRHWTHDRTATEIVELRKEVGAIRHQFDEFQASVGIQDKDELEWSERFERLANRLVRLPPSLWISPPGMSSQQMCLYPSIFRDPQFRETLQTYIVQLDGTKTQFSQRKPAPHELRSSNMRETIKKAEQCLADFQKNNPNIDLTIYTG